MNYFVRPAGDRSLKENLDPGIYVYMHVDDFIA